MDMEFIRLRKRMLRLLFAIGFVCNGWFLIFETSSGIISARDAYVTYPSVMFIYAAGFFVIELGDRWRAATEWLAFLSFCANCASGVLSFTAPDEPVRYYAIADTLQWIPLISIIAFMIFPGRQSVVASVVGFLIPAGTAGWVWWGSDAATWPATTSTLLFNALVIHVVSVAALVLFSHSQAAFQRARAEARMMESAALSDPLTGIANRRGIERALETQTAASVPRPWALILLDMDHFKMVNDERGHVFGDRVLQNVVNAIRPNLRGGDVIGRWGGDEFLVISPGAPAAEAEALAERLRQAVAGLPEDDSGGVTISAGIALWNGEGGLVEALRQVDAALYRSKQMGRNRVVFA